MTNNYTPAGQEIDGVTGISQKKKLVKLKANNNIRAWKHGRRVLRSVKIWLGKYDNFYVIVEPTNEYDSSEKTTVIVTHLGIRGSIAKNNILDFLEEFGEYGEVRVKDRSKNMDFVNIVVELG